jgi:hypothetical protein
MPNQHTRTVCFALEGNTWRVRVATSHEAKILRATLAERAAEIAKLRERVRQHRLLFANEYARHEAAKVRA